MNISDSMITGLKSLLALAGMWGILFWLYRDYRLDVFRQELFALRDRLFDLATAKVLSFDHPAYGTLRRTINGFIRFGHRLTLSQVILLVIASRWFRVDPVDPFEARWNQVATDLPGPIRAELDEIIQCMHRTVMKQLVLSSPVLLLLMVTIVVPILLLVLWRFFMDRLVRRLGRPLRLVDSVAVAYGG